MDSLHSLISESLKDKPIGQSKNFIWFITEIGIAALMKLESEKFSSLDPIQEATHLNLDLSKEELELIKLDGKLILLFYS